jgi:hypothetical protein
MIISPPFLPSQPAHEIDAAGAGNTIMPDHDVCTSGMQQCAPGNGAYPVSYNLGWHGGPHLIAPKAAHGHTEPVRAIADGKVVYVRRNSPEGSAALQYRNVRTDDGCVVIKHTTEIGEGDSAAVTFFSIYMHLQSVAGAISIGKPVYRKDLLGAAGQIYGQSGQIHFEIVCNDANLRKLVGRTTGPLIAKQGRADAIYGDTWFKVPKGAKLFENEPHPYRRDASEPPLGPHRSVQSQRPIGVTSSDLIIRMHYEKGACTLTTFKLQQDGSCTQVGHPPREDNYEYDLYQKASSLNAQYADGSTSPASPSPKAPSPSLIYEMLRFGRPVGETMPSEIRFGHWRKIVTPEGTGWINLNRPRNEGNYGATPYPGISVYSDADFPHWAGWSLIDDDSTSESLCESPTIKKWLDLDGDGHITHAEAKEALHDTQVAKRMAQAVCKFPIEWTKHNIEERWGWLKTEHEALAVPLSNDEFATLKAHIDALAFWEDVHDADLPPAAQCWHFPPKAFIEHFRKCGWLSMKEFEQIYSDARYSPHQRPHAGELRSTYLTPLNVAARKYGLTSPTRLAHFLGQGAVESGWLGSMQETSMIGHLDAVGFHGTSENPASKLNESNLGHWYGAVPAEDDGWFRSKKYNSHGALITGSYDWRLGNCDREDAQKFRGRGFKQLTGRSNYADYWLFRGWLSKSDFSPSWWSDPAYRIHNRAGMTKNPAIINNPHRVTLPVNCIDSGGFYLRGERHAVAKEIDADTPQAAEIEEQKHT